MNEKPLASERQGSFQSREFQTVQRGWTKDLLDEILEALQGANLDHAAGRLGLEGGFLTGEGVDTLASLGGRLVDDGQLEQAGNREGFRAVLLEVLLDQRVEAVEHSSNLLAGQFGALSNAAVDFALGRGLLADGGGGALLGHKWLSLAEKKVLDASVTDRLFHRPNTTSRDVVGQIVLDSSGFFNSFMKKPLVF